MTARRELLRRPNFPAQRALNVEPTTPQLRRLEMLNELAAQLEAKAATSAPKVTTPADLAAARERLRAAREAERKS